MIRISSGVLKGRVLKNKGFGSIRPTTSLVRESLFNILGTKVKNSCFLDVFAGSGAVGFEAFSRGAKQVFFIEKNFKLCNLIKQHANFWNVFTTILCGHYRKNLSFLHKMKQRFDIIFLDPPYFFNHYLHLMNCLLKNSLFKKNSLVVIETHKKTEDFFLESNENCFEKIKDVSHGLSHLVFYQFQN